MSHEKLFEMVRQAVAVNPACCRELLRIASDSQDAFLDAAKRKRDGTSHDAISDMICALMHYDAFSAMSIKQQQSVMNQVIRHHFPDGENGLDRYLECEREFFRKYFNKEIQDHIKSVFGDDA